MNNLEKYIFLFLYDYIQQLKFHVFLSSKEQAAGTLVRPPITNRPDNSYFINNINWLRVLILKIVTT
jgi:hypothetical protein